MDPVKSLTARDWTVADAYEFLPESGTRRYEVIDGELFVSPEASWRHQRRIFDLAVMLDAACPPDAVEVTRPFPVRIAPGEWTPLA